MLMESNPTALVILVPEADPLVASFRDQYDPSAADGMPAHITVLYPFMDASRLDTGVRRALAGLARGVRAFKASLREVRRWPDVLYLEPEPEGPFRALTGAVSAQFPDYLPYGGEIDDPTPHLTVAQVPNAAELAEIEVRFRRHAAGSLPLDFSVSDMSLMVQSAGRWVLAGKLDFGR